MKALQAQVRAKVFSAGYDLPDGPILPPMDMADEELRKLGALVSHLSVALGRESDLHVYHSTVPATRSKTELRAAVAALLLGSVELATQFGLDAAKLLAGLKRDDRVALF